MADDKPITIGIASDTRAFEQGVKSGVIDPLDDVAKAADKAGKSGDKAGDELSDGMKDAQTATERFGREFKSTADDITRQSQTSSRRVTQDFDETTTRGKESFKELGNEAKQNAAETFSSFDGSAQSFVGGIQGTLGGIVSSLGPVGAAAGAAGALGIGLITSAFQTAEDKAAELAQRTAEATDDMIASGRRVLSDQFLRQAISDQLEDDNLKKNQKRATELGLPLATVAAAYAGVTEAQDQVLARTDKYIASNQKLIDSGDQLGFAGKKAFQDIRSDIDATIKSTDDASTAAGAYGVAISKYGIAADDATAKTKATGDAVNNLPKSKTIPLVVDSSQVDSALQAIQKKAQVTVELRGVTRTGEKVF